MSENWRLRLLFVAMLLFVALVMFLSVAVTGAAAVAADLELAVGLAEATAGSAADLRASAASLFDRPRVRVRPA